MTLATADLRRIRLSDAIVLDCIGDLICDRLRPGSPLPSEPELVARYNVSKVVIHEAIRVLAFLGMVEVKQGKRSVVTDDSEWNLLSPMVLEAYRRTGSFQELLGQLYEARLIVEPEAARFTAQGATGDRLEDIRSQIAEMRTVAYGSRDVPAFLGADRSFHDAVARAVGNVAVRAVVRDLHRFTATNWEDSRLEADDLEAVFEQHARIAEAIVGGHPERARKAMVDHLRAAMRLELGPSDDAKPKA